MNRDDQPGTGFDDDAESARLRALYRELPSDEPPSALDDAILAAARRATGSRPRVAGWWSRSRSGRAPLAAAVLLLAFVVLVREPWQRSTMPEGLAPEIVAGEAAPVESTVEPAAEPGSAAADVAKEEIVAATQQESPGAASGEAVARSLALADNATGRYAGSVEDVAAPQAMPAPAPAPAPEPAVAIAPSSAPESLPPRNAPWPFGLVPTLAPDTACARLVQDSGGRCHGRVIPGGLELQLSGSDAEWLPQLRSTLHELGWQKDESPALDPAGTGTERYMRATRAGTERFNWSLQGGSLVLHLQAAAP